MEEKAIKLIQDTAIIANGDPLPPWLVDKAAVLPDSYGLHNLESFAPNRFRFRGLMSTTDIDSFVGYVNNQGSGQAFINPADFTATTFFNLGDVVTPGHADWKAKLSLQKTAAYAALLTADGQAFSQIKLVEFFEDWAHLIAADRLKPLSTGGEETGEIEMISVPKLIAAIRRIKIKEGSESRTEVQQYAASQSRLDQVSAESDEGLPDNITFRCDPYHGLPERTFNLRLSILTSGPAPQLKLRIVGIEAAKEAMLDDFEGLLRSHFGPGVSVVVGTFAP
jgi:uncharacterized protein YfdQ (DUF2303 family)